jgi:hypothetical protein
MFPPEGKSKMSTHLQNEFVMPIYAACNCNLYKQRLIRSNFNAIKIRTYELINIHMFITQKLRLQSLRNGYKCYTLGNTSFRYHTKSR